MHAALELAEGKLGLHLYALRAAAIHSLGEQEEARRFLQGQLDVSLPLDIVVCGSTARQEMSGASDFDYLVVAHGLVENAAAARQHRLACDEWCERKAIDKPGSTGIFGAVVSAPELVERIGLETDTNASLTRRVLMLEEGASVLSPERHRSFVSVVLGRYLLDETLEGPPFPRFLLNDLARYWRTIAVDYQAKIWGGNEESGWALRYLKLRFSRKLTYAGSLAALFLATISGTGEPREFLTEQFVEVPPLARLAQLTEFLAGDDSSLTALAGILGAGDRFTAVLADRERRDAIKKIDSLSNAQDNPDFVELNELSTDLQDDLERVFLTSDALGTLGRKYMAF